MDRIRRKYEAKRDLKSPKEPLQWIQPAAAGRQGASLHRKVSIIALPSLDLESPTMLPDLAKQFELLKQEEAAADRRKSRAIQRRSRRLSSRDHYIKFRKHSDPKVATRTATVTKRRSPPPASHPRPQWWAQDLKKSVREKRGATFSPLSISASLAHTLSPRSASAPTTPKSPKSPSSSATRSPLFGGMLKMFGHRISPPLPPSPSKVRVGNISSPSLVSNTWDPSLAAKTAAQTTPRPTLSPSTFPAPLPSPSSSKQIYFPLSPTKVAFNPSSPATAFKRPPPISLPFPSPPKRNFGPAIPTKATFSAPVPPLLSPDKPTPPSPFIVATPADPLPPSPTKTESSLTESESEIDTPLAVGFTRDSRFPSTARDSTESSVSGNSAYTFNFFDDEEETTSLSESSKLFAEADRWLSVGETLLGLGFSEKDNKDLDLNGMLDVHDLSSSGIINAFPLPNEPSTPDHSSVASTPPLVWTKRVPQQQQHDIDLIVTDATDSFVPEELHQLDLTSLQPRDRLGSEDSSSSSQLDYAGSLFDMYEGSEGTTSKRSSAQSGRVPAVQESLKRNTFGTVATDQSRRTSFASLITSPSLESTSGNLAELHKLLISVGVGTKTPPIMTRESSLDGDFVTKAERWTLKEMQLSRVVEMGGRPKTRRDIRRPGSVRRMPLSYK